jgi:dTDP-4-dehydrorhamnose reductase
MRVLVIGGDGLIGGALTNALEKRGDIVIATTRRPLHKGGRLFLDLQNTKAVPVPRVDVAIFCAAVTTFDRCRQNKPLARRTNVTGTSELARRLVDTGAHVLLLSTTAVFGFHKPLVPADAVVNPSSAIGEFKAEAEAAFREFGALASILRLTKVLTAETALFANWMTTLTQHQHIVAFTDHHIAPLTLDRVTNDIIAICEDCSGGIYQLSGAHDISYFDAARFLARRMKVHETYVHGARAIDSDIPPGEVCRFTSLDGSRLAKLTGMKMPEPHDVLEAVYGPKVDKHYRTNIQETAESSRRSVRSP